MTDSKTTPDAETATIAVPVTSAEGSNPPAQASDDAKPDNAGTDKPGVSSKVWMGTAVGVGSAALVAALMYAKRRK